MLLSVHSVIFIISKTQNLLNGTSNFYNTAVIFVKIVYNTAVISVKIVPNTMGARF